MFEENKEDNKSVAVLEKAILTLEFLLKYPDGASLSEIAAGVGLNKSTVYRILQTYKKHNYVVQSASSSFYRLGGRLLLFSPFISKFDLASAILPYMQEFSDTTSFSTNLALLDGYSSVTIETYVPPTNSSIRIEAEKGFVSELYCCATGKIFLAYMDQETFTQYLLNKKLLPVTEHTITDPVLLVEDLKKIRENGYSVEMMENEKHIISLAAPIFNAQGEVQVALGMMMLSSTASNSEIEKLGKHLNRIAQFASHGLGAITY